MIRPKKLSLAAFPSPLHQLRNLSKNLNRNIYIKRDDSTGMLLSGNKIRKLEYVLKEALDHKADTIVTCGGIDSNHIRSTSVAAKLLGLQPYAVLHGGKPEILDGNLLLTESIGANTTFVSDKEYAEIDRIYSDMDRDLRKKGLTPYFIPSGASNALGCWGYISMMEELMQQQKEIGVRFDSIFVALGSGGTVGGLILGKFLVDNPAEVFSINVFSKAEDFEDAIFTMGSEAIDRFQLPCTLKISDIHYFNNYIGRGYALTTDEEMAFILDIARSEGVVLDQVYTGKALFGTVDLLKRYPERFGRNILFIHTGGWFSFFRERERITRLLDF